MTFQEILGPACRPAPTGYLYMFLEEWFRSQAVPDTPDNRGTLIRMIHENHVPGWRGLVLIYPDFSALIFPYHPEDAPGPDHAPAARSAMTEPLQSTGPDRIRWRVEITWPAPGELILHVRIAGTPTVIEGMVASLQQASTGEGIHRWLARFLSMPDVWRRDIPTDLPPPPDASGSAP